MKSLPPVPSRAVTATFDTTGTWAASIWTFTLKGLAASTLSGAVEVNDSVPILATSFFACWASGMAFLPASGGTAKSESRMAAARNAASAWSRLPRTALADPKRTYPSRVSSGERPPASIASLYAASATSASPLSHAARPRARAPAPGAGVPSA